MGLRRVPRWIRPEDEALERERRRSAAHDLLRPALRLIVCGDSTDRTFVFGALDRAGRARHVGRLLIAVEPGAAQLAAEWAERRRVECFEFPTEWESFGALARLLRNADLFRAWPNGVVVFGDRSEEIVDLAAASNIPIWKPAHGSS